LEAYYEPQFSDRSHGFRPNRGCHPALRAVRQHGHATKWFIEGDLCACFDRIDHSVLLSILRERFPDNRFLRLMRGLLQAGYLEEWTFNATYSGVPQGGVGSPILSNIVLDRLDTYVATQLIPAYTRGQRRRTNPPYVRLTIQASEPRKQGDWPRARRLCQQAQRLPSRDPHDPNFRRLWYVRYAGDMLLGLTGGKPKPLPQRTLDDAYSIVAQYQAEYRGVVQYYRMACNLHVLQHLKHVMEVSLVQTLAKKHRRTCAKIYQRYGATIHTDDGVRKVLRATLECDPPKKPLTTYFGGGVAQMEQVGLYQRGSDHTRLEWTERSGRTPAGATLRTVRLA